MAVEPALGSREPLGISNACDSRQLADQPRMRDTGAAADRNRVGSAASQRDGELVAWFVSTVAPRLHSLRPSDIRRALGCGGTYAIAIRRGARVPHPRLFRQLAGVAGVAGGNLDAADPALDRKPQRLCRGYCNFTAISVRRAFQCIGNFRQWN